MLHSPDVVIPFESTGTMWVSLRYSRGDGPPADMSRSLQVIRKAMLKRGWAVDPLINAVQEWTFIFEEQKFRWRREMFGVNDFTCVLDRRPDPAVEMCM